MHIRDYRFKQAVRLCYDNWGGDFCFDFMALEDVMEFSLCLNISQLDYTDG